MALLHILSYPDPRLRQRAQPVEALTNEIIQLIDDMFETMYHAPGIGLAATQVNVAKRVITIDISEKSNHPLCLINPEIIKAEGSDSKDEGCLSVPNISETVTRASKIWFRAIDRNGQLFENKAEGLLATCIQHEIDHLDGKLFIDYLSDLKRNRIRKKIEKHIRQSI